MYYRLIYKFIPALQSFFNVLIKAPSVVCFFPKAPSMHMCGFLKPYCVLGNKKVFKNVNEQVVLEVKFTDDFCLFVFKVHC